MNIPSLPVPVSDLDPVFVASPVIRSGTTLLQRLLCSAPNTLIYGETCAADLEFFLQIYSSKAMVYQHNQAQFAERLAKFRAGETDDWILDLMPDVDGYLAALARGTFAGAAHCRAAAAQAGRPVWGMKYPGWPPQTLGLLRRALPRARWVYLYRDVWDCVRSAKAWQHLHSLDDVRAFCAAWTDNLSCVLAWPADPNVLVLDFGDLTTNSERCLERLAAFTGAQDMNPAVLARRINAEAGYLTPAELSDAERQIIEEIAGPLRARLNLQA